MALAAMSGVFASPTLEERQGRFTFYDMLTPAAGPCDLVNGPDNALWGEDILINKIFRVDPATGKVTEYDIPFTTPLSNQTIPGVSSLIQDRTALSCAIRSAQDGNLYASNGLRNQLVKINPTTKKITVIQPPVNPTGNLFNL
jgi:streptogramin lyase